MNCGGLSCARCMRVSPRPPARGACAKAACQDEVVVRVCVLCDVDLVRHVSCTVICNNLFVVSRAAPCTTEISRARPETAMRHGPGT
eukprot:scaffold5916_cov57-Phaeocystis_antarctica.AAC.3